MNDISLLKVRPDEQRAIRSKSDRASPGRGRPADLVEVLNSARPRKRPRSSRRCRPTSGSGLQPAGARAGAEILALLPVGGPRPYSAECRPTGRRYRPRACRDPPRAELLARLDKTTARRAGTAAVLSAAELRRGTHDHRIRRACRRDWTVGGRSITSARSSAPARRSTRSTCSIRRRKRLVQAVSLRRLIAGDPAANVLAAAPPRKPITVSPLADREEVARLISKYDLLAVPVVDEDGHVLGIVTVDDVIDAIDRRRRPRTCRSSAAWRRSTSPI